MTTDMFFSLLKRKTSTERSSMGGFPQLGEEDGTVKKNCLARPSKDICPKCMLLGISGVIWSDLRTLWSYFSNFRIQIAESQCVIKRFVRLINVYSPVGLYTFCKMCRALHGLHFVHH